MVPDDLHAKVAVQAIECAMQLDGLVLVDVRGKIATPDIHMFGVNPKWSRNLRI